MVTLMKEMAAVIRKMDYPYEEDGYENGYRPYQQVGYDEDFPDPQSSGPDLYMPGNRTARDGYDER